MALLHHHGEEDGVLVCLAVWWVNGSASRVEEVGGRVVCADVSQGRESVAIPAINDVDDLPVGGAAPWAGCSCLLMNQATRQELATTGFH